MENYQKMEKIGEGKLLVYSMARDIRS